MKKVLFASTALIAAASMAAAEVRISGYGRFGLDYNEDRDLTNGVDNGESETSITSRLRLQFDVSTETDGGVTLGARTRAQIESRDNNPGTGTFNGARFYATFGGFTLGVGNIIGAIEGMPGTYLETRTAGIGIDGAGFVSHVGNVNNEYFNWDAYSSAGAGSNGIEVLYSAGGFAGHVSYSEDDGLAAGPIPARPARTAINVSYTFGDWTAALGYQDSDLLWEDKALFSIYGNIGNFGVRFAYADNDGIDKYGLYGSFDIGAASTIVVFVTDEDAVSAADVANGRNDNRDNVAGSNQQEGTSYGINYSYDLGGGASFEAGIRESSADNLTAQAGVYFSF